MAQKKSKKPSKKPTKKAAKKAVEPDIRKGLVGVIADTTAVSKVMPETNSLTYRGYAVQDLAASCSFQSESSGSIPYEAAIPSSSPASPALSAVLLCIDF